MLRSHRADDAPFDIAVAGISAAGDNRLVEAYAAAGATWWLEAIFSIRGSTEKMLARISAGPPVI